MSDMDDSPAPRAKRQKIDKKGRLAALERLKQLKGSKNKYEVSNLDNVYEEVDEKEYTKRVLERQDDDWIVDDGGCGYVEDGREIFDDDLDDDSITSASRNKRESGVKRGRHGKKGSDNVAPEAGCSKSNNIRNMLMSMPAKKKKEVRVKLDEDDVLGDIMEQLDNGDMSSEVVRPGAPRLSAGKKIPTRPPTLTPDMEARSYLKSLSSAIRPKPVAVKPYKKMVEPVKVEEPSLMEEDQIVSEESELERPSDDSSTPVTASQTIENFDSNDLLFGEDDLKEMDIECQQVENGKENVDHVNIKTFPANGNIVGVESIKQSVPKAQDSEIPVVNGITSKQIMPDELPTTWETMDGAGNTNNDAGSDVPVHVDISQLPVITTDSGEQVLRFFWLDAHEEVFKQPGTVFLFGKVWVESAKTHVSCCIVVKNIQRRIFILPREKRYDMATNTETDEEVKMMDVYKEFNEKIAGQHKILEFKSRKVTKNYAFSIPGVPIVSEYLEVLYPASHPMLPSDLQGETFSHVFGTNTSSLEHLLVDRKMKGPCWLDIKCVQQVTNPISWCKLEATVLKPENVTICSVDQCPAPPPLVVVTLNIRSALHHNGQNEIVMLSCLVHKSFHIDKAPPQPPFQEHFCAFTRPSDMPWPYDFNLRYKATKLEKMDTERGLLGFFLAKLFKLDPDLIVGHDLYGYGLELLLHRMNVNKIPQWSKIGRLRRANIQMGKGRNAQFERNAMCGRLVCDVKISAKELIRSRSYELGPLCETVLRIKEDERKDVTIDEVKALYKSTDCIMKLVSCTMQDTAYIIRLMCELNVLPLALQITNIAGNVMSRTLMGGRSERNEYLLLHAFVEKNYNVPDKQYGKKPVRALDELDAEDGDAALGQKKKGVGRKKPSYAGGLVLEPRKGFYDKMILLMDFNSLYPSIIQEYNICFTTINLGAIPPGKDDDEEINVELLLNKDQEPGILPTEIRKLVESRREVKKLMNTPDLPSDLKMQYNIRQMALKLTANSMYGCLGFSHSRFYAKPLAALVTAKGREILMNTKDLVEKLNFQVIYGDTDSIMINTNCVDYDQVFKIGNKIKAEVNKLYRQVELEVDGVFKYMLLLKKKKYAAVTITRLPNGNIVTQQEMKGLDIVRRDWSQLSAAAGKFVLEQILSDLDADERIIQIHEHLERLKTDLEEGKVPLSLLGITKQLTKNPEDYADKKSLPHVQVALRLNQHGGRQLKQGDTVAYVICEDGTNNSAIQRAYHVDELKSNENLKIDIKYYLSQQIHPVVSRLCEPIEGTDAARIAEILGMDPSSYRHQQRLTEEDSRVGEKLILSDEERYRVCSRFKFNCKNTACNSEIIMDGPVVRENGKVSHFVLEKCSNPQCTTAPLQYLAGIQNSLTLASRNIIHQYYENWMVCGDPVCTNRTRCVPLGMISGYPRCNLCSSARLHKECDGKFLYTQLSFFQYIFDLSKVTDARPPSLELEKAYDKLREQAERTLRYSAYNTVDLSELFQRLTLMKGSNCS